MKKHELLEQTMILFPKGTQFYGLTRGHCHTSKGIFRVIRVPEGLEVQAIINKNEDTEVVYFCGEWAKFKKDILQFSAEGNPMFKGTEFYEAAFSTTSEKWYLTTFKGGPYKLDAESPKQSPVRKFFTNRQQAENFIQKNNIDAAPIFTTVDGVFKRKGDLFYHVYRDKIKNIWGFNNSIRDGIFETSKEHMVVRVPDIHKGFHSKEVAEKWIEDQNTIKVTLKDGIVAISKDNIDFRYTKLSYGIILKEEDLLKVVEAYNSIK